VTQRCHGVGKDREVPIAVQGDRALEQGDSLVELPPDVVEIGEPQQRLDEAARVLGRFRDPECFPSVSLTLVERPTLGQGARQEGMGQDGGRLGEADPLTGRIALEQLHQAPAGAVGPPIVARQVVDVETIVPSGDLERHIAERLADGLGSSRGPPRIGRAPGDDRVIAGHVGRHPSQPALIVECRGEGLRFPKIRFDPAEFRKHA
jgi:hypothetical protein